MSMTLASFGVVFLSFGGVVLLIGTLGLHFGSRESLGGAGMIGLVLVLLGAVFFGAGYVTNKRG
jgi:drug/metabolite transporter (DMT)-like permease